MSTVWNYPTRVVFGAGCLSVLPRELHALGAKRPMIVTDQGLVRAGLIAQVHDVLRAGGFATDLLAFAEPNPTEPDVWSAAEEFKRGGADCVIGIGGGSALDVGKLVGVAATHTGPLVRFDDAVDGSMHIHGPLPPIIAIPTTAGTGSEVGRSGVVTIGDRKVVIFSPLMMPKVALLDPQLTVSLPAHLTAATGMDALTHCIEAYCATGDHPLADAIALQGIELCVRALPVAVQDPTHLQARGDMMKAAMMGAAAFQKGLGACHSLAHPLSAKLHMHHGLANALALPAVIEFNRRAVPERVARIAMALGLSSGTFTTTNTLAESCAGAVRSLRSSVGILGGLSNHGVQVDDLNELADLAYADACHRSNPRACTRDDLLHLYEASFSVEA